VENWEDEEGGKRGKETKESRNSHWHSTSPTARLNHCQCNNTVTDLYFSYSARFVCLKNTSSVARSAAGGKLCSKYHVP